MLGLLQVHPHVVKLYNVLHSDRTLTLVFEFCKQVRLGWVRACVASPSSTFDRSRPQDLRKYLDSTSRDRVPMATVKSLLYQLLAGISFCHVCVAQTTQPNHCSNDVNS